MIVKKPYAFLIKHFKIIHLLLLVPMVYITFKFGDIASFFQDYVKAGYTTVETAYAGKYVTILTYIVLILLILANGIVYLLMKSKKKNTWIYSANIIYCLILTGLSVLYYGTMQTIEVTTVDATFINFVRDISLIFVIPSYILLILTLAKGLGFNFKTLRFDNNLNLHATDEDEEEIELKIGADNYAVKKTVVHTMRELKYYILENKFVFTCLGALALILILISFYMNFQVYNKRYNLYQAFALDTFTITLKESYITNVDYSGTEIDKDHYFLAVKIAIHNKGLEAASIDKSNFRLYFDDKILYPNYDRSSRFIDIGNNYQGTSIYSNASDDYVLVYEIDKSMIKKQYQMKILSNLRQKDGKLIPSYKTINIKPTNIVETIELDEASLQNEISLDETMLGETKIKINNVEFTTRYSYDYEQCYSKDNCSNMKNTITPSTGSIFMVINDDISWDENSAYYKNGTKDFYYDFVKLKYNFATSTLNKEYTSTLKNVTPENKNGDKVYEVSKLLLSASNTKMQIKVRNKVINVSLTE